MSDFQARAREVLAPATLGLLAAAGEAARRADRELYVVGGAVRDVLLGRATEDLDLLVVGEGARFAEGLAEALSATIEAASAFGTWRLSLAEGGHVDLVAARAEIYAEPAALPTVATGTLAQDLARRDFTVNALAVRLGEGLRQPVDLHGGLSDLADRRLRVLHPDSLVDDPTRILRGLELAQRLGFLWERGSEALAKRSLSGDGFAPLSPARFRTAWRRSFGRLARRGQQALQVGLESADALGLFDSMCGGRHDDAELATRLVAPRPGLKSVDRDRALQLLRALAGGRAQAARRLASLWSSREEVANAWEGFVERAAGLAHRASDLSRPSQVAAALDGFDDDELELLYLRADSRLDALLTVYRQRVLPTRLGISGADLTARGVEPGPAIGAALSATLAARLDGDISAADELEYACQHLRSGE